MKKQTKTIALFGILLLSFAIYACDKNDEPPMDDSTGVSSYTEQDWEW